MNVAQTLLSVLVRLGTAEKSNPSSRRAYNLLKPSNLRKSQTYVRIRCAYAAL